MKVKSSSVELFRIVQDFYYWCCVLIYLTVDVLEILGVTDFIWSDWLFVVCQLKTELKLGGVV